MKIAEKKFLYIIAFASMAMLGIIILQSIWYLNAFRLKNELFDYKVGVALKSIVNKMVDIKHDTEEAVFIEHFCQVQKKKIIVHIDKSSLESIIKTEFESIGIDSVYEYAVIKCKDTVFVLGDYTDKARLLNSVYTISLSCVSQCTLRDDFFRISFFFPKKEIFILKQLLLSLILNFIFFIVLIAAYYKTVLYYIRLMRLSAIKTQFVNNLTHEFKTPIATITLASEMLKREPIINDTIKRSKYVDMIYSENERLKTQVNQILQLALIEKEELVLNEELLDVHKIIDEVVTRYDVIVVESNGNIIKQMQAVYSFLRADMVHLNNVFSNLVDNSVKYSESNPHINIRTYNDKNRLIIEFSDTGRGISKEHLSKVFEQFYRVPTGDVHNIKGFGLGLFYVDNIVKQMHGTIGVKSEFGKGTTFILSFPYEKE